MGLNGLNFFVNLGTAQIPQKNEAHHEPERPLNFFNLSAAQIQKN